jgi:spermidine synthase
LLDTIGAAGTLKLLAAASGGFVLLIAVMGLGGGTAPRLMRHLGVMLLVVATAAATPRAATLWARLHGASPNRIVYGEDASGLSVVRMDRLQGVGATVFVNGLGQSTIPYGDIHTALGMVPAFVHPAPRDVVVIGLGSGDTVYGAAGRQEIERIVSVEIIGPQLDTLQQYAGLQPYGDALRVLTEGRIQHVTGDGRIFLMRSGPQFDIIEADALRPTSAYSGNLYSDEYFRLVQARLRPGGLAVTWAPSIRVHNAFLRVFPYVLSVPAMLLGSDRPIAVDRAAIAARVADPRVQAHYAKAGVDVDELVEKFLAAPAHYTPDFDRRGLTDYNTDLFPKDEFDLSPRR